MSKTKLPKESVGAIVIAAVLVIAHVVAAVAICLLSPYFAIYPSIFEYLIGILACIFAIIDIIFFVGLNHKDLGLKIVSCVLAVFLLLGGSVGTYALSKVNTIVDNVLDDGSDKYETFSGVFVSYDKNNTFTALKDLNNKKVGMLNETTNGLTYIATELLKEEKIDYATINYSTNTALMQGLIDGEVDAIAITPAYREIYSLERDENSPFASYLDRLTDFYSFEKELKVDTDKKNKNLSTEPFNVLLIGYSRTDIGSSVGLADSIIVATINPQTYTVSMMSIARDSFVPIPCYGGEYDKINSGRSTSRQCFIDTVEDFIGMDIDYYMELDYLGLVQIVRAIGGIVINNPVDFELDGIYVPAGKYLADGMQVLEFCRERHHMPNGDFDRQQHQKEVIIAIAQKFIESGSVSLALTAMDMASEWMSTDLTLNQLTTVFNLLLNTKNYTSLDTFDLVDFHTLRMTGDGGLKYYSYSMHLPLWVYLIYQGSYDESIQHINDVMGNYSSLQQDRSFEFSMQHQYERPLFYSLEYPDKFMFTPDPMPAFWGNLIGMTASEAMEWANSKGVSLSIEYIKPGDDLYNEDYKGLVYDQSVRYGSLVSDHPSGVITVMLDQIDPNKVVPDFVGHNYQKAIDWAKAHDIPYHVEFKDIDDDTIQVGDVISQNPKVYTDINKCERLDIVVKSGSFEIRFDKNGHGKDIDVPKTLSVKLGDEAKVFANMSDVNESGDLYVFQGWYTAKDDTGVKVKNTSEVSGKVGSTTTLYAHWAKSVSVTFKNGDSTETRTSSQGFPDNPKKVGYIFKGWNTSRDGSGTSYSSFEQITSSTTLYAIFEECTSHEYGEWVTILEPTCSAKGTKSHQCSKCGKVETDDIDELEGDACKVTCPANAICDDSGTVTGCVSGYKLDSGTCVLEEEESHNDDPPLEPNLD